MTCQNCGDEYSSLLSDTGSEGASLDGLDRSKSSGQPRRKENKYKSWNFQYRLQTDILGVHGVSTDEKKTLLVEHLQTRLGHLRPRAVLSVTVFCDFEMVFRLPPDGSSLISIPIVGFVQSESRTALTMTQWFPDAKWAPVPGGLADHPDFLRYMSLVENTAGPWFKLSVFGELGLNNAGRRAARENRKVFLKPFIHFLARPSD